MAIIKVDLTKEAKRRKLGLHLRSNSTRKAMDNRNLLERWDALKNISESFLDKRLCWNRLVPDPNGLGTLFRVT